MKPQLLHNGLERIIENENIKKVGKALKSKKAKRVYGSTILGAGVYLLARYAFLQEAYIALTFGAVMAGTAYNLGDDNNSSSNRN